MYAIRDIPLDERPRERLRALGPEALSHAELLAILLGSGMRGKPVLQLAQELIAHFGSLQELAEASVEELCIPKGMGEAKAIQLKAAFSLAGRLARSLDGSRYRVQAPVHAYQLLKDELEFAKEERFFALLLDTKGYLIRSSLISIGTLSKTLVHPREVFFPAIRHKAASLLVAHNHPSGDPTPSREDIQLTQRLFEVGEVMGIPLNDHIVIGRGGYCSLRERGDLAFQCFK